LPIFGNVQQIKSKKNLNIAFGFKQFKDFSKLKTNRRKRQNNLVLKSLYFDVKKLFGFFFTFFFPWIKIT